MLVKVEDEDLYVAYGQTKAGRYLVLDKSFFFGIR